MKDNFDLSCIKENWESPIVPRSQFDVFSCGVFSPAYMANLDSKGKGPDDGFYLGNKKCYTVDASIRWLEARASRKAQAPVQKNHDPDAPVTTDVIKCRQNEDLNSIPDPLDNNSPKLRRINNKKEVQPNSVSAD